MSIIKLIPEPRNSRSSKVVTRMDFRMFWAGDPKLRNLI